MRLVIKFFRKLVNEEIIAICISYAKFQNYAATITKISFISLQRINL